MKGSRVGKHCFSLSTSGFYLMDFLNEQGKICIVLETHSSCAVSDEQPGTGVFLIFCYFVPK